MFASDALGLGEVGDRAGDADDAVVTARAQRSRCITASRSDDEGASSAACVRRSLPRRWALSVRLRRHCRLRAATTRSRIVADDSMCPGGEFGVRHGNDVHVQVDAIEQWAGDASAIAFDRGVVAAAVGIALAASAARAWVHRGDE